MTERTPSRLVVIAGTGPSLTHELALKLDTLTRPRIPVIAVSDAYRMVNFPVALVAADLSWWRVHADTLRTYAGKRILPIRYEPSDIGVSRVTQLRSSEGEGFIPFNCGQCSGFAAISWVLNHWPRPLRLVLVGYDMRIVDGKRHFFGDHPAPLRNTDPAQFVSDFESAAALLPSGVEIINATPGSALRCFPFVDLEEALKC